MEKSITFKINMILDIPEDWGIEDTLGYVRAIMVGNGLSEYINKDNLIEYD